MDEVDRIASNTKFNGTSLLDGSFGASTAFDETTGNAATISVDAEATTHTLSLSKLRVVKSADNETVVLDMSTNGTSLDFDIAANDLFGDFQGLRIIQGSGTATNGGNNVTTSTWEAQVGGKLYIARDVFDDLDNTAVTFTEFDPIGAAQTFTMTNSTGANLALDNQIDANRLSDAINYALKGRVGFQVGSTGSDKVDIGIGDGSSGALGIHQTRIDAVGVTSVESKLAVGTTPAVAQVTGYGATEAVDRLSKAIESVLSSRASIGAYTSRFDKAFNAISTSIQNQDAARGVYLDADVAEESSNLAAAQVKMNASISVLAQANDMNRSLLKLMG